MHDLQNQTPIHQDDGCFSLKGGGRSREFTEDSEVYRPTSRKMPGVDLHSYLLSASPPGFDLHYTMRSQFNGLQTSRPANGGFHVVTPSQGLKICKPFFGPSSCKSTNTKESNLKSPTSKTSLDNLSQDKSDPSDRSDTNLPKRIGKKRVSFADDLGKQLEHIRILTERPSSPPRFQEDFLSSLADGSTAELTDTPPLKLNFTQPASDYVAFREKIERNLVSLENVILKDYHVMGTIKVKNICFEKKVQVRCTFDSWESFTEIPASYVHLNGLVGPYDTFSFDMDISPKLDPQQTVQFAVLYETNGAQYWDNNGGSNYEIVPSSWQDEPDSSTNSTERVVFGLEPSSSWTEFCGWNNMSNSVPYW